MSLVVVRSNTMLLRAQHVNWVPMGIIPVWECRSRVVLTDIWRAKGGGEGVSTREPELDDIKPRD